jgi:dienelactone hydrolase
MPIDPSHQRFRLTPRLLAAASVLLAAALPARADVVSVSDMLRGFRSTPAQCAAMPAAVWVKSSGHEFCIRYYLSTAGGEGARPVVFLQGDRLGRLNLRTGEFSPGPRDRDLNLGDFQRIADILSRQNRTTAIYLARPGLDGSSGDHRIRHTVLELNAVNGALDAIKQRHNFDGFHLIGQSGGSKLIGGMLALRTDVGCAAIGAGRLASRRPSRRSSDPATDYYDVADAIPTIAKRSTARILVVTDPEDTKVPERHQTAFVEMLRKAGGRAEQFLVRAADENRHGVTGYARLALTGCIRGAATEEIAARLQKAVERQLAAKAAGEPNGRAPSASDHSCSSRVQVTPPVVTQ